jgi:pimeloyl-ACP methyl ester carboxylesterase
MGETAYARCGDLSLAYQVHGDGPVNLVLAGSFVSNVEMIWSSPDAKAFFDHLASFSRLLIFDKAGVGLSDPVTKARSIEERAKELEAVMDAAGMERAALIGLSEGGPAAIVLAATRPDRVQALVLIGTFPHMPVRSWDDANLDPDALAAREAEDLGAQYAPSAAVMKRLVQFIPAIKERWGSGDAMALLLPSVRSRLQLGLLERMSASPGMAIATVEAGMRIDVRSVLPTINVPTLVLHAKDDLMPVGGGRYLADHIPGARMIEFEGSDHAPWLSDPKTVLEEVETLLTGSHHAQPARRALRTVLFTDVVASTERMSEVGDQGWRGMLGELDTASRDAIERFGGQLVKGTGDGHLATFEGPAQAIRCAEAIAAGAGEIGLEVRAGIHVGECELIGDDIGGIAVHIASRVTAHATAREVLVSSTVRDLVVGSGIGFEDRGIHELKGVPGSWQLLAVRRGGAAPGSSEARLVALPTPPTRSAMRRSDRAFAAVARRAPIVLRSITRVTPRAR